jgi:hypothetical protein
MQHLYEFAIVRVVPRVEREEFVNVGVILFCKKASYLEYQYQLNPERLKCLFPHIDIELIEKNLISFGQIAKGAATHSPISKLTAPERFRWLTATRSTIIQCSKVHPGMADTLENTMSKLMREYVLIEEI